MIVDGNPPFQININWIYYYMVLQLNIRYNYKYIYSPCNQWYMTNCVMLEHSMMLVFIFCKIFLLMLLGATTCLMNQQSELNVTTTFYKCHKDV